MGAKVSVEQQGDLGVLALATVKLAQSKPSKESLITLCGAVAHVVPLLAESDIRLLMLECDNAITATGGKATEWVELMTVLRRLDRP